MEMDSSSTGFKVSIEEMVWSWKVVEDKNLAKGGVERVCHNRSIDPFLAPLVGFTRSAKYGLSER